MTLTRDFVKSLQEQENMRIAAEQTFRLFDSFIRAGFTEKQAISLIVQMTTK